MIDANGNYTVTPGTAGGKGEEYSALLAASYVPEVLVPFRSPTCERCWVAEGPLCEACADHNARF